MTKIMFYADYNHEIVFRSVIFLRHKIMSVLFILIGVSLLVAIGFLVSFLWSVKSGQYDDDYTPSVRMLFDDELKKKEESINQNQS